MYWRVACLVAEPGDNLQFLNLITKRRFLTSLVLHMTVCSPKACCSNLMVLCPSSYNYGDHIWNIVVSHAVLISALELSGHFHASAALSPQGKAPGTLCVGGWVSLRAVLDVMDKTKNRSTLPGIELQFPHHPAPNLVTILRYPGLDYQEFSPSFMERRVWFVFLRESPSGLSPWPRSSIPYPHHHPLRSIIILSSHNTKFPEVIIFP
jgi:hypothetical protein